IIDEVQRVPELLSTIQVLADASKEKGRFILTGSHQPKLHAEISQSLA
ncbi:MAG: AAA family ATPase, partial [Lentisphaeria bacterium]|nr:AAA family ATPase [Lentisphaeria bacterium]